MSDRAGLKQPELFHKQPFSLFSRRLPRYMTDAARRAETERDYQPNLAVIIRTRNDMPRLERLFEHIALERQSYQGRIDVIVVDTESTDDTLMAAAKAGAQVVKIRQRGFNYPMSINIGLSKVKKDVPVAFITVGHAVPALGNCLSAGVRHFRDAEVVGVYSDYLPDAGATFWERAFYFLAASIFSRMKRGAHRTPKIHGGIMQAVCCFVRMETWKKYPFDETFAHGGEDVEWARRAFDRGHVLVYDPAVTAYHSHGLGLINFLRQAKYWLHIYRHPGEFDAEKVHRYRPDLR